MLLSLGMDQATVFDHGNENTTRRARVANPWALLVGTAGCQGPGMSADTKTNTSKTPGGDTPPPRLARYPIYARQTHLRTFL